MVLDNILLECSIQPSDYPFHLGNVRSINITILVGISPKRRAIELGIILSILGTFKMTTTIFFLA